MLLAAPYNTNGLPVMVMWALPVTLLIVLENQALTKW